MRAGYFCSGWPARLGQCFSPALVSSIHILQTGVPFLFYFFYVLNQVCHATYLIYNAAKFSGEIFAGLISEEEIILLKNSARMWPKLCTPVYFIHGSLLQNHKVIPRVHHFCCHDNYCLPRPLNPEMCQQHLE